MPFGNPILGGSGTLIRRAIRSPDYVAGVSGWSINKDGTVEFNDGTFRGDVTVNSLVAGTPGGERIEITSTGELEVYNSSNELIASLTANNGYRVESSDGSFVEMRLSPSTDVAIIQLMPPIDPGLNITTPARLLTFGSSNDATLLLISPTVDGGVESSIELFADNGVSNDAIVINASDAYFFSETVIFQTDNIIVHSGIELGSPMSLPVKAFSSQNPTWTGSTTYTNSPGGAGNLFGTTFVAPPSGTVDITVEGWVGSSTVTNGRTAYFSFEVREGSTVGSGTIVGGAANDDRAGIYRNFNAAGSFKYAYVTIKDLYTGLTPGQTYNVSTLSRLDNAADTGALNKRKIIIIPSLVSG